MEDDEDEGDDDVEDDDDEEEVSMLRYNTQCDACELQGSQRRQDTATEPGT